MTRHAISPALPGGEVTSTPKARHHGNRVRDVRIAGWAGIVSTFIGAIPFYITGRFPKFYPYVNDSHDEIFGYFVKENAGLKVQCVAGLAFVFYLWFAAGFLEMLRAPGRSTILGRVFGWCAVCAVIMSILTYTVWALLTFYLAPQSVNATIVAAMYYLSVAIFLYLYPFLAVFMACAGMLILRTETLPRWLGVTALVVAVPNALVFFTFFDQSSPVRPVSFLMFTPMVLFCLWVVITGIHMVRWRPSDAVAAQE